MTTATAPDPALMAARAEFYLCLARAFLPPTQAAAQAAITEDLPADLADLGQQLQYPIAESVAALRDAARGLPEPPGLLQLYSRLFLSPPALAGINAGVYLDGAVMGNSVVALDRYYREYGLARDARFHDLPDHVALQLEFVAYLFARAAADAAQDGADGARHEAAARDFLQVFVAAWLPGFCADLERVAGEWRLTPVYLHLAQILRAAVAQDARRAEAAPRPGLPAEAERRPPGSNPTPEEIAEIARILAAKGHSIEHLAIPLAERDKALGLKPLDLPEIKPGRSR
ncbi:MAG: molecular chaperone [Gammaproteobacteria bacterium]